MIESTPHAKPACNVADIDPGDLFRLVLRVSTTLDRAGQPRRGTEFWDQAMRLGRYHRVIELAQQYVEVRP